MIRRTPPTVGSILALKARDDKEGAASFIELETKPAQHLVPIDTSVGSSKPLEESLRES